MELYKCDFCQDTGFVHVLRFFKNIDIPYQFCDHCTCDAGRSEHGFTFQKSQIGNHYTLVNQKPMMFIDDRIYERDLNQNITSRIPDIVKSKEQMSEIFKYFVLC